VKRIADELVPRHLFSVHPVDAENDHREPRNKAPRKPVLYDEDASRWQPQPHGNSHDGVFQEWFVLRLMKFCLADATFFALTGDGTIALPVEMHVAVVLSGSALTNACSSSSCRAICETRFLACDQ